MAIHLASNVTAATNRASDYSPMDVVWPVAVIVGCVAVLVIVAKLIRRATVQADDAHAGPIGFTLADLRAMHAAGQLSDEELVRAEAKTRARTRAAYLGEASDDTESDNPTDPTERAPDIIADAQTDSDHDNATGTDAGPDKNGREP